MRSTIRFVVQNGNTFGYVIPEIPDSLQILAFKPQLGSSTSPLQGSCPLCDHRPAKRQDFEDFRVGIEQYENANGNGIDNYEIPTS